MSYSHLCVARAGDPFGNGRCSVSQQLFAQMSRGPSRTSDTRLLKWAEKRTGGRLPSSAWEQQEFTHFMGGRDCAGVRIVHDDGDTWAIRANDPDKNIAQRIWTTEIVVAAFGRTRAYFSLRLLMSSPEWDPDIQPAVPGVVRQILSKRRLFQGDYSLTPEPWVVREEVDTRWLIDSLVDRTRRVPIIVIAGREGEGTVDAGLDVDSFSRAVLGLARVVVLPAKHTWALTRRFGKSLAVFNGAVRMYRPGFEDRAEPRKHELIFIKSRADAELGAARLQQLVAGLSLRGFRLGHEVLSYAAVRDHSHAVRRERLRSEGATDEARLSAALEEIDSLKRSLDESKTEGEWYAERHDEAEERARVAEAQLVAGAYRVQQLTEQLSARGEDPDSSVDLPHSWSEFAGWCDEYLVGRVVLAPRARREVGNPQFHDVAAASRCLRWLAKEYRERRLGQQGGGDLRVAVESGIRNDRCGGDEFKCSWQGRRVDVDWHIKNGGNTRDPSRCLRIYYFWDEASQQVVVASMPGHVRTGAS